MKININMKTVKAMQLLAARNDVRHYLCSVLVEVSGRDLYYVATNGHFLGVFKESEPVSGEAVADVQVIIPNDVLDRIKPGKHSAELATLSVEASDEDEAVPWAKGVGKKGKEKTSPKNGLEYDGAAYQFLVDARYPDWRRVLPRTFSGAAGHYNPAYLMTFQKLAMALGRSDIQFAQNGEGGAGVIVESCPNFMGVLMARRPGVAFEVPAWVWSGGDGMRRESKRAA